MIRPMTLILVSLLFLYLCSIVLGVLFTEPAFRDVVKRLTGPSLHTVWWSDVPVTQDEINRREMNIAWTSMKIESSEKLWAVGLESPWFPNDPAKKPLGDFKF